MGLVTDGLIDFMFLDLSHKISGPTMQSVVTFTNVRVYSSCSVVHLKARTWIGRARGTHRHFRPITYPEITSILISRGRE